MASVTAAEGLGKLLRRGTWRRTNSAREQCGDAVPMDVPVPESILEE
eukprot:CAMPEP_0179164754 /NCGR_PEP_ID=MMETSP0796-20121207/80885_1 /TAXON_ID=73915 /ORGANISM="Pyrodinium bahamense, Strain pbaha01" /LENGTH=46 /DNA_ID= /DNA_START= /DNA_END= /DNA_ORIENTATION=